LYPFEKRFYPGALFVHVCSSPRRPRSLAKCPARPPRFDSATRRGQASAPVDTFATARRAPVSGRLAPHRVLIGNPLPPTQPIRSAATPSSVACAERVTARRACQGLRDFPRVVHRMAKPLPRGYGATPRGPPYSGRDLPLFSGVKFAADGGCHDGNAGSLWRENAFPDLDFVSVASPLIQQPPLWLRFAVSQPKNSEAPPVGIYSQEEEGLKRMSLRARQRTF
jgi:hypothetical protein